MAWPAPNPTSSATEDGLGEEIPPTCFPSAALPRDSKTQREDSAQVTVASVESCGPQAAVRGREPRLRVATLPPAALWTEMQIGPGAADEQLEGTLMRSAMGRCHMPAGGPIGFSDLSDSLFRGK